MASLLRAVAAYHPPAPPPPPIPPKPIVIQAPPAPPPPVNRTGEFVLLILVVVLGIGPVFALLSARRDLAAARDRHRSSIQESRQILDFIGDAARAIRNLSARLAADVPPKPVIELPPPAPEPFDTSGVQQTLTGTSREIAALNTTSVEIGHLTEGIRGISFRTNILSLNASIEAAHAGDRGAGFGIVATEVKDMAAMARESAEEIATRVAAIQLHVAKLNAAVESAARTLAAIPTELPSPPAAPVPVSPPSIAPEIAVKLSALANDLESYNRLVTPDIR